MGLLRPTGFFAPPSGGAFFLVRSASRAFPCLHFAGRVPHAPRRAQASRGLVADFAAVALCGLGTACPLPGSGCAGPLRGLPCVCWSRRAATCSVALFPGGPGASLGGEIRPAGVWATGSEKQKKPGDQRTIGPQRRKTRTHPGLLLVPFGSEGDALSD